MIIQARKIDKNGGRVYIEWDTEQQYYHEGNTGSHDGFYTNYGYTRVYINVNTLKEIRKIKHQLEQGGFLYLDSGRYNVIFDTL